MSTRKGKKPGSDTLRPHTRPHNREPELRTKTPETTNDAKLESREGFGSLFRLFLHIPGYIVFFRTELRLSRNLDFSEPSPETLKSYHGPVQIVEQIQGHLGPYSCSASLNLTDSVTVTVPEL